MIFNLDIAIVIAFLIINLAAGVYSGRGIKNITEYAVGNRNFSTATISATVIATWIGGGSFAIAISKTYTDGLLYLCADVGTIIGTLIVAYVFAPRMQEFLGKISVAEVMGSLYGRNVRLITSIGAIALSVGSIAVQIKVMSSLFNHFFGLDSIHATLISSSVVILYSSFGGIKAVTFTDVIQFFTFGIFVPLFAIFVWKIFGDDRAMLIKIQQNPIFNLETVFNLKNPTLFPHIALFLYFLLPTLNPAIFQRMLMSRDIKQIQNSFSISAVTCFLFTLVASSIGIVILAHDPTLNPSNLVMYIIDNYSYPGLKGFTLVGIIAMVMSTADSHINSASVIFAHDVCKPFGVFQKVFKNELLLSRIFAVFLGTLAVIMTLSSYDLLGLVLLRANFYMPIVTVPLILTIMGFRSTSKSILAGIIAGATTVVIWRLFVLPKTGIDSVIPGAIANLIITLSYHYLLKQPGGWKKTKQTKLSSPPTFSRISRYFSHIAATDMLAYCNKKLPKKEIIYSYFALSVALTLIITLTLDKQVYKSNVLVINIIQAIALFITTMFLGYRVWANIIRKKYIGIIWYVSIFIGLAFNSSFLVLLSNFSQPALVIFVLNLSVIGILVSWRTTIVMILTGALSALCIDNLLIGGYTAIDTYDLSHIAYALFMVITFILMFLKPKEEEIELAEEKIDHLSDRVDFQNHEIDKLTELKYEFLRNIEHEAKTPITGITNLAELLWLEYDNISEPEKRKTIQMIAISAERLKSFISNFIDLSQLSSLTYAVNIKQINLSNLLQARFEICRKLYTEEKHSDNVIFELNIDDNIMIKGDEYLLSRVIDNLIINSIKYCPKGLVNIALKKGKNIEFTISDQGIGIPADELSKVFGVMVVSSRTQTPAGGRGVGLALCKKIIELHKGSIWAEGNSSSKGVTFKFVIPL